MSFLDNSGDIILDAVLTDTGRRQLARGDGSFRIVKFAFGDDEVNYELYATGAAGANRDLDILQSPVFEAFTNNTSTMKSKLLTIANNNLLYLPVNKLNQVVGPQLMKTTGNSHLSDTNGAILLSVDSTTSTKFSTPLGNDRLQGLLLADGTNYADSSKNSPLAFDQGLDNNATGVQPLGLGSELRESQYIIEVDNRLLNLCAPGRINNQRPVLSPSFIDDDNIASYFISFQGGAENLGDNRYFATIETDNNGQKQDDTAVNGRPGYRFRFGLKAAQDAETTDYLFTTFGNTTTDTLGATGLTTGLRFIDTTVRITGFTTGYRVDVPVRLLKAF